jgi:hypothetical protein
LLGLILFRFLPDNISLSSLPRIRPATLSARITTPAPLMRLNSAAFISRG